VAGQCLALHNELLRQDRARRDQGYYAMSQIDQFIEMLKQGGADYDLRDGTIVTVGITEFVFNVSGQIQVIYRDTLQGCC
jgi:hypothetical protein